MAPKSFSWLIRAGIGAHLWVAEVSLNLYSRCASDRRFIQLAFSSMYFYKSNHCHQGLVKEKIIEIKLNIQKQLYLFWQVEALVSVLHQVSEKRYPPCSSSRERHVS